MKLTLPALRPDQYPDLPEGFLLSLSSYLSQVQMALTGRLSVKENLAGFFKTVTLDEGSPTLAVKNELAGAPSAVLIAQAFDLTAAGRPPVSLGAPAWSTQGEQILIHSVSGMTTGHRYSVTLLVLGS